MANNRIQQLNQVVLSIQFKFVSLLRASQEKSTKIAQLQSENKKLNESLQMLKVESEMTLGHLARELASKNGVIARQNRQLQLLRDQLKW